MRDCDISFAARTWPLMGAGVLFGVLAGCDGDRTDSARGPTVALVDSLVLSESDTFPRPAGSPVMARAASGDVLLEAGDRILHFGSDGRLIGVIGRPGEGPGELRRLSAMAVLPGDSLLAAVSTSRGRIVVYRLADGVAVREVVMSEPISAAAKWSGRGDTVVIPVFSGKGPLRRWVQSSDTAYNWGADPPSRRDGASRAYMAGGDLGVEPYKDGYVALVPADSMLVIYDGAGEVQARLLLPALRRRHLAADAEEQVLAGIRSRLVRFVMPGPLVMGIHRMPDGRYLTLHFDGTPVTLENPLRLGFSDIHYWVGIISADLSRACVDGQVPDAPEEVMRPLFSGDTLMLLVRSIDADGQPRTVLRQYRVSDEGCDWVETGGVVHLQGP